jgi:hypothetical protein
MRCVFDFSVERFQFLELGVGAVMFNTRIVALVTRHGIMLAIASPENEVVLLESVYELFVHG